MWDITSSFPRSKTFSLEPGADGLIEFCFALQRQPMRGWQFRHGEICAGGAHWIAKTIAVDAVHLIEVAVDEQDRLRLSAAMGAVRA
jgi:hypothetical protein